MAYLLVFLCIVLAAIMVFGGVAAARLVAPYRPGGVKSETYECGETTIGSAWLQFNVGYYLFALLFVVFDVESAFLYPWATVLRESGWSGVIAGILFIAVLVIALIYAWRKGALQWE